MEANRRSAADCSAADGGTLIFSNCKEIADLLYLSEQTIKAHISNVFKKFNVSSRTQLISLLVNTSEETSFDL